MGQILELSPQQTRQTIDAETVFLELLRARREAAEVRGSMFWRTQSGAQYLIRESSGGGQKSLGARTPETEQIYQRFKARKEQAQSRLAALMEAAHHQQRLNKALRVGRVPGIVIKTLNALQAAGLQDHFMTIGTHSLYAYESACGVRFSPDAMATQDIDLLFDSRKRIAFMSRMKKLDSSFIAALQKADPTFRVMPDQRQTAINDSGFEVDVIRRTAKDGDDLWAVQVEGADKLLSSERFSQVVVAETGHMALMTTMNPITFIALKKMISKSAERDPRKRRKDALQAEWVQQLVKTHMPQYADPPPAIQVGSKPPNLQTQ